MKNASRLAAESFVITSYSIHYTKLYDHALILRPLLKDGFRTAVTVLGVAIGVAVFLAIRLANVATLASFEEKIDAFLGRADLMIHADGLGVDETVLARLTAFRDQVRAYPVVEGYGVETASGEVVEFLGTDLSRDMGVQDVSLKTKRKGLTALLPRITSYNVCYTKLLR